MWAHCHDRHQWHHREWVLLTWMYSWHVLIKVSFQWTEYSANKVLEQDRVRMSERGWGADFSRLRNLEKRRRTYVRWRVLGTRAFDERSHIKGQRKSKKNSSCVPLLWDSNVNQVCTSLELHSLVLVHMLKPKLSLGVIVSTLLRDQGYYHTYHFRIDTFWPAWQASFCACVDNSGCLRSVVKGLQSLSWWHRRPLNLDVQVWHYCTRFTYGFRLCFFFLSDL